jgi:16S rRNA (adenine1518-N6/adenine1519-N6)-dimethyltransferase
MPTKLGQNFLVNKEIAKRIVKAANLKLDDLVLEIGSGKGILTEELVKYAGKVVAVEIDGKLFGLLRNKLRNINNVEIVEGDILKFKFQSSKFKTAVQNSKLKSTHDTLYIVHSNKYKVIANLPYYITSPVIRKFLEAENPPSALILMVQKEVAERICAGPGKMSVLAVAVQYYAKPEILFHVKRENFDPVPEVDSAVIKIVPNPSVPPEAGHLPLERGGGLNRDFNKRFFQIVRAGFCAKRKTLANNVANSFYLDKDKVGEILTKIGLNKKIRAQELSVEDWKKLSGIFIGR